MEVALLLPLVFVCCLVLTVASAAWAIWLAVEHRETATRKAVVQRLSQIALLGAITLFALLERMS